jgi:hypothetical protein
MNRKQTKKLSLDKQTMRRLSDGELTSAAGGAKKVTFTDCTEPGNSYGSICCPSLVCPSAWCTIQP